MVESWLLKQAGPSWYLELTTWFKKLVDESFNEKVEDLNQEKSYDKTIGHKEYYGNVISTLRGEGKPICDGEEGLKSLEILEATYLSSLSGQLINIPLEI